MDDEAIVDKTHSMTPLLSRGLPFRSSRNSKRMEGRWERQRPRKILKIRILFFIRSSTIADMKNEKSSPLAYMITCRTYASWLHGDERKSVDRKHNLFLTPKINKNPYFQKNMQALCKENMFLLDEAQRKIILQRCKHWIYFYTGINFSRNAVYS